MQWECVVPVGVWVHDSREPDSLTFQLSFKAFCATDLGVAPFSMASANSLNALAAMEASTVFTRDTF